MGVAPYIANCVIITLLALAPAARSECRQGCGIVNPSNTYLGTDAFANNLLGMDNTAIGNQTLFNSTTASGNTAVGSLALNANTTGYNNTAVGKGALSLNTTALENVAIGYQALNGNTTGKWNTAVGTNTLFLNQSGSYNTAVGQEALHSNSGSYNTALGRRAMYFNTSGTENTSVGYLALYANETGENNTATGYEALLTNTTGINNVAYGHSALYQNTTGSRNIAIGTGSGYYLTTGNYNIDIGNTGVAGESGNIRIGTSGLHTAIYVAGVNGAAIGSGVAVRVNSNGQLGTTASSARFKEDIRPMKDASESILKLEPVTFRYKRELSPEGTPEFGLVAEQVEKVDPDLIVRDKQGKPFSVRYDAVNAMLLNEFLKEHRRNERQESKITEQEKEIDTLKVALKEQAEQIQTLSERFSLADHAAHVTVSNQ